ncbi:tRNA (uracil-5-)-methyltransferase homolog B-like [Argiope bruennichi]|uniref:tRNA (uracil-5-)-methyltransferase homolog B-like n=1 Tax=Argiope bruennichi TaxID=94029 RepID=UPI0024957BA4|nr:tRNA (uracil-5-)-methyltransferase homolog B-like [Argiope bruennichi]
MALSIRNLGFTRNSNCFLLKNKHSVNVPSQNSLRHLRGSRHGRILYRTEAKFQELLKSLNKHTESSVVNITEIPESVVKSAKPKEPQNEKSPDPRIEAELADPQNFTLVIPQDVTQEDIVKRLDEKITPLKNFTYAKQLEKKYNKSLSVLRMFGEKLRQAKVPITIGSDRLPCPVELMLPSPIIESYRNQDEFSIGTGIDGNPKTVGFYLEDPNDKSKIICVEPSELVIIKENHKKFAKDFERYIRNSPWVASTIHDDVGFWKSVKMKSNMDGDLMGIVSIHPRQLSQEELEEEKRKLCEYFTASGESYNLKSLYFQTCSDKKPQKYNFKPPEEDPCELLFGDKHLVEQMDHLRLSISPESFFLPNTTVAASLYGALQKICRMHSSMSVLDIFCGVGAASLVFSNRVKKCIGVDTCFRNVADAVFNASKSGIENVEFLCKMPESVLHDINDFQYHEDLIAVISPARAELSLPVLKFLRRCKHLSKIIYITTKPRLAVDNFVRLCKPAASEGYLGKPFVPLIALPVDLLPQTEHYALAVVFQRF